MLRNNSLHVQYIICFKTGCINVLINRKGHLTLAVVIMLQIQFSLKIT